MADEPSNQELQRNIHAVRGDVQKLYAGLREEIGRMKLAEVDAAEKANLDLRIRHIELAQARTEAGLEAEERERQRTRDQHAVEHKEAEERAKTHLRWIVGSCAIPVILSILQLLYIGTRSVW